MNELYTQAIDTIAINQLHLGKRLYKCLSEIEVQSASEIMDFTRSMQIEAELPDSKMRKDFKAIQAVLNFSLSDERELDWLRYLDNSNIELVPQNLYPNTSNREILFQLIDTVRQVFRLRGDERYWVILEERFALHGGETLTLQDLGDAFDLTRERVRQLEEKALDHLRAYFVHHIYISEKFRVHPRVSSLVKRFANVVSEISDIGIREEELFKRLDKELEISCSGNYAVTLLLRVFGLRRLEMEPPKLAPIWTRKKEKQLLSIIKKLDLTLTKEIPSLLGRINLLSKVNKGLSSKKRLNISDLDNYLEICGFAEKVGEDTYRGKFEFLVGRENQVERLLIEEGKPIDARKLTREINFRRVPLGDSKLNERNLRNQLMSSKRFTPIGKSGYWGLASWEIEDKSILEYMEEALMVYNEALSANEIYLYVKDRREVSKNSINIYLAAEKRRFTPHRNKWLLSSWSGAKKAETWNRHRVNEFVDSFFRHKKLKEIEYGILTEALAKEASVSSKSANGMLRHSSAIETRREGVKRFAVFQANYSEVSKPRKRRKKTKRQKVEEMIPEILSKDVNYQMLLGDVIRKIQSHIEIPKHSLYQYLAESSLVKYLPVANSKSKKMCQLVRPKQLVENPDLEQIGSFRVKDKVERALTFLTDENVDVALSLLSKEFESVLKAFVVGSSKNGKWQKVFSGDPKRWKLFDMVEYAHDSGTIGSKADLNYLREVRNQRAHGTMPSPEEMRELMKTGEHIAGLYIHYIAHFDNLLEKV